MSVGLLKLSFWCIVTISVLGLFLMVPWVRLQCVIVVVPGHALLSFGSWSLLRLLLGHLASCNLLFCSAGVTTPPAAWPFGLL